MMLYCPIGGGKRRARRFCQTKRIDAAPVTQRAWCDHQGRKPGRARTLVRRSGQDGLDDLAVDVGQAEVATLEAVGQARVVDAQEVQQRGLEVVDVDGVLDDVHRQVVRL